MKLLVLLIGMVMILEGIPYVGAPQTMKEWLAKLSETDPNTLRILGLVSMAIGLLICYIVQQTGFFEL